MKINVFGADVTHIILLADQQRLINLFTGADALSGASVHVVAGIEDAVAAFVPRKTNIFFVQNRLGGVSGEVIAHRLVTEMKGKKARIVMLGEPEGSADSGLKPARETIDISLPDAELVDAVLETLSASPSGARKRHQAMAKDAGAEPPEAVPDVPLPPPETETVADVVALRGKTAHPRDTAGTGPGVRAGKSRFLNELESALETPPVSKGDEGKISGKASASLGEGRGRPILVTWESPSFVSRLVRTLSRSKGLIIALSVLVCAALILPVAFRSTKPHGAKSVSGKAQSKPGAEMKPSKSPPVRGLTRMPSFVPRGSPDPHYGKTHPGWESYGNSSTEFRVFREKDSILGLQILDRSGQGITQTLLASAVAEIAGSRNYLIETMERKGGYLVEKGRLKNGAGIIIYRKEPDGKVKAFVIDFH